MTSKTAVKKAKRSEGGGVGSLMLAFVAFVLGYLLATVFDINQMHAWVNNKMLSDTQLKTTAKVKKEYLKPKLEFYTLLAQDNRKDNKRAIVNKKELEPPKDLKSSTKNLPVPGTFAAKNNVAANVVAQNISQQNSVILSKYVLQVGSFKNKAEAEKMRADLVIKGFDVIVVAASQQNENWYRVMVGPVVSLKEAETLKSNLASRERINGMIRKFDA